VQLQGALHQFQWSPSTILVLLQLALFSHHILKPELLPNRHPSLAPLTIPCELVIAGIQVRLLVAYDATELATPLLHQISEETQWMRLSTNWMNDESLIRLQFGLHNRLENKHTIVGAEFD